MREFPSPLSGFSTPFGTHGALSAYAIGSFEPDLVFDFGQEYYRTGGTATTFDSAITFSRISGATYVDGTGTIQTAAPGVARVGHHVYNGSAWVNEGVLVESEARTNLLVQSNDFTVATGVWNNINVTTAGTAQGPDGVSSSATQMLEAAITGEHQVGETFSFSPATSYTLSVFVKSIGGRDCTLFWFTNSANTILQASFDLTSGTVLSGPTASGSAPPTNVAARIEKVGNFYRVSISGLTGGTAGNGQARIHASEGAIFNYAGDVTKGLEVYGAQLEAGSVPSSYIPTSGSTVTRAADTLTVPSAKLPWPTPNVIGPELVTNGTFDTDVSGWSVTAGNGTIQSVSGELELTCGTTGNLTSTSISTTVGKVYQVVATGRQGTFTSDIQVGPAISPTVAPLPKFVFNSTSSAEKSVSFVATATTTYLNIRMSAVQSGATAYFDNISVREIDPLAVSIQMQGRMTYADEGVRDTVGFLQWNNTTALERITIAMMTDGAATGKIEWQTYPNPEYDQINSALDAYSPGINVPFNIASRHGSTFINGAVDGTALTADTTPTALPDLSSTDLQLGYDYMGTIKLFRIWANDLGDAGIAEAST